MATARPFAYNTGAGITGTDQVGSLAVGTPTYGFASTGLPWWNGPDEDLGYVIAASVPGNTQPTPVPDDAITLSSTYKGTDISVTNNNQTAAQIFGYQQSVLGETIISDTNQVMFSVLSTPLEPLTLPQSRFIGVGKTTMNYQGDPYGGYPGNDTQSIGFNAIGEYYYNGSVVQSGLPTWTDSDIIDIAISHGQGWWIRVNGGYWNNNPAANPATLTGYLSMNGLTNFYPTLCPGYQGIMTIQNNATYGVPSGYNFLGNVSASVGFFRSSALTDPSFISLANVIAGPSGPFASGSTAKSWLNANGYWTSYSSVVTTGLKVYLDALNPASYSGSGTTWYDLSGNGNDVSMQNSGSITWSPGPTGYFSTVANGWFNRTSASNVPIGNSPYTLSAWVQLGSSWNGNGFMSIGPFGNGNEANAFRAGSTNQLLNYWWGNDLSVNISVSPTNGWFNAVAKYDGTTRSIWVNGVLAGSDTPVGHNVTSSDIQISKTAGNEYLQGNIAQALIYNVALSGSEILANFNATKSRFGL